MKLSQVRCLEVVEETLDRVERMLKLLLKCERQNNNAYHTQTWSSAVDTLLYADWLERVDRLRWANRGWNDDVERRRIWREERDKLVVDAQREVERQKELGVHVPFIFHAGETLGDGSAADMNLYDAILMGTKRIGHGCVSMLPHNCV